MGIKYIGMDVHMAMIVVVVLDARGHLILETLVAPEASALRAFFASLSGRLYVTFEESTMSDWLHQLLSPWVEKVIVCDPRKNVLLKKGNKNDRLDARKLAELLRAGLLSPVYPGGGALPAWKESARSYLTFTQDTTRVMNRLKALYRGSNLPCPGQRVYSPRYRAQWLEQLHEPARGRRAERLYQQLDALQPLRRAARRHPAHRWLRSIPCLGPLRAALLLAILQNPQRFRTKRQLWAYAGLALITRISAEYTLRNGRVVRTDKPVAIRGLNPNHHHQLKELLKGAATTASSRPGPWQPFYQRRLAQGMKPPLAHLTLARKIAALVLHLWKKGECFDAALLTSQAA